MNSTANQDSALSTSANVVGILTFVVAIEAAAYARIAFLRNSSDECFRVKTSLSWYKTESTWLADLLRTLQDTPQHDEKKRQHQMYSFVMDDLLNLEQRLLELVTDIEVKSALRGTSEWTLLPRGWSGGKPLVAVSWMAVRTKAMELARQREALTARVQFLQMSMISARIDDLEGRLRRHEREKPRSEDATWESSEYGE